MSTLVSVDACIAVAMCLDDFGAPLNIHSVPTRRSSDLDRFLAVTGIGPDQIRAAAGEPGFLAGVLAYLASDETLATAFTAERSEEHTSELQSRRDLVCRLLLEKKNRLIVAELKPHVRFP